MHSQVMCNCITLPLSPPPLQTSPPPLKIISHCCPVFLLCRHVFHAEFKSVVPGAINEHYKYHYNYQYTIFTLKHIMKFYHILIPLQKYTFWETEWQHCYRNKVTHHNTEVHSHSSVHWPCRLSLFYWVLVLRGSSRDYRCRSLWSQWLYQRHCVDHLQE